MLDYFAVFVALWFAHKGFHTKGWSRYTLCKYQDIMKGARDILKTNEDQVPGNWFSAKALEILQQRIHELEILIKLDPVILGALRK